MKNKHILQQILLVPGFFSVSEEESFVIKPGRKSSFYINVKELWNFPYCNNALIYAMEKFVEPFDTLIGIETGGSPYASSLAFLQNKSLILCRKEPKKDAKEILTSKILYNTENALIIDDVIGTGNSMSKAITEAKEKLENIALFGIFTYGMDSFIQERYNIEVYSMFQVEDILDFYPPEKKEKWHKKLLEYREDLIKEF